MFGLITPSEPFALATMDPPALTLTTHLSDSSFISTSIVLFLSRYHGSIQSLLLKPPSDIMAVVKVHVEHPEKAGDAIASAFRPAGVPIKIPLLSAQPGFT